MIQYNWEGGIAIPTTTRISKDMILDTAFSIAREEGIDNVSNRLIAKRLNSSIRPIYYQFKNSKELKFELKRKIEEYFYSYITEDIDKYFPMYKQIGIRYIMFAKEECNLFKALFMSESNFFAEDFVTHDENYKRVFEMIKISANLDDSEIKNFHIKMWIFTHGIGALVANKTVDFSEKQIKDLLSYEFQALMLLEENPNNKWVIKEEK